MKTLPLSVLAYDGPITRAYLATLNAAGLKPQNVTLLLLNQWGVPRPFEWLLSSGLRRKAKRWNHDRAIHYWPRTLIRSGRYAAWISAMQTIHAKAPQLLEALFGDFAYEEMAETFAAVEVSGFSDPRLATVVNQLPTSDVLYTGGGIVPASLLSLPGKKFLHVHPGILPDVRGADGVLWSILTRRRAGATVFYLDSGIDTGDILFQKEFDVPSLPATLADAPGNELYRALFSFCDPMIRAATLLDYVLAQGESTLPAIPQNPKEGMTYHFMHPELRDLTLKRMLR